MKKNKPIKFTKHEEEELKKAWDKCKTESDKDYFVQQFALMCVMKETKNIILNCIKQIKLK